MWDTHCPKLQIQPPHLLHLKKKLLCASSTHFAHLLSLCLCSWQQTCNVRFSVYSDQSNSNKYIGWIHSQFKHLRSQIRTWISITENNWNIGTKCCGQTNLVRTGTCHIIGITYWCLIIWFTFTSYCFKRFLFFLCKEFDLARN